MTSWVVGCINRAYALKYKQKNRGAAVLNKSLKWFGIFRIILLTLGITGLFSGILFSLFLYVFRSFFSGSIIHSANTLGMLQNLFFQSVAVNMVLSVIFLIAYLGLTYMKKIGYYAVLSLNILIPVTFIAHMLILSRYLKNLFDNLDVIFPGVFLQVMRIIFSIAVPSLLTFFAVLSAVLMAFNSNYFVKRKELFK